MEEKVAFVVIISLFIFSGFYFGIYQYLFAALFFSFGFIMTITRENLIMLNRINNRFKEAKERSW